MVLLHHPHSTLHFPTPWKQPFLSDIQTMEGQEFAFSTLHTPKPQPQPRLQPHRASNLQEPRTRFCAFRSFWAEIPNNSSNPAPRNESVFVSDMPTFTTDVRTGKVTDVLTGSEDGLEGSGGGAPCEAVWWARENMRQWRIRGRAYIIAPDIETDAEGAVKVRHALRSRMRLVRNEGRKSWSWSRELTAHFGNLSPSKRGRFVAPPPGRPVDEPFDHEELGVGREIYDLEYPVARKNFRVVVIVPEVVERLEMQDPKTARRHVYRFDAEDGSWSHQECWP